MRASRRDYLDIVKIVRKLEKGTTRRLMWAIALGEVLARSNSRFDKKLFIDACAGDALEGNVVHLFDDPPKNSA